MNLKSKKVILNDEAYFFMKYMNDYNEENKIENNFEKDIVKYYFYNYLAFYILIILYAIRKNFPFY